MESLISAKDLNKQYGATRAVDKVSFEIAAGEIVGLIGPNGAGKSTLLKSLLGLIRYDGKLEVLGQSPRKNRAKLLESLSYIADVASLPEWISVKQLLAYMGGIHPGFDRKRTLGYLERTQVTTAHRVKALSKGMKTQLHLALIMGVDTRLLILDEPTLGLDIIFRTEFYETLANEYHNAQRGILVTTHQVEEIERYLTRVMFIHHGRILFDMPTRDIAKHFLRLTVEHDRVQQARQLGPIFSGSMGDKQVFIYENRVAEDFRHLGTVGLPSLADLFVAKVKGVDGD